MLVDVVLCKDCDDFEQDPRYPHMGNCYNGDVIKADGVPYVSRHADDYCSYAIKKEKSDKMECSECGGTGWTQIAPNVKGIKRCPVCNGTGKITQTGINNFKIITLCGSTKFKKEFEEIYKKLSLEGNIVLTVACFGHVDSPEVFKIPGLKDMLDEMHKEKIRMSDGIFVINPNNYIGNSTKNEIEFAKSLNKDIQYLEDPISKE